MSEEKKNPCSERACVPYFVHEGMVEHISHANRRMLIALLSVCITFLLTIIVFVFGYTQRESNWLETMTKMQTGQVTEVTDGVQQQPSP